MVILKCGGVSPGAISELHGLCRRLNAEKRIFTRTSDFSDKEEENPSKRTDPLAIEVAKVLSAKLQDDGAYAVEIKVNTTVKPGSEEHGHYFVSPEKEVELVPLAIIQEILGIVGIFPVERGRVISGTPWKTSFSGM